MTSRSWEPDTDRARGVLSDVDREFLRTTERGGEYYRDRKDRWDRRETIKQRVRDAVIDFYDLCIIDKERRRDVFDEIYPDPEEDELYLGLLSMVEFAYMVSMDAGVDFENIVAEGVERALWRDGMDVPVDGDSDESLYIRRLEKVTVDIDPQWSKSRFPPALLGKLRDGEDLTDDEIIALFQSGIIEDDEDWQMLRDQYSKMQVKMQSVSED